MCNDINLDCLIFNPDGRHENCLDNLGVSDGDNLYQILCRISTTIENLNLGNVDITTLLNTIKNNPTYLALFENLLKQYFEKPTTIEQTINQLTNYLATNNNNTTQAFLNQVITHISNDTVLKSELCKSVSNCGDNADCGNISWQNGSSELAVEHFQCLKQTINRTPVIIPLQGCTDYEVTFDNPNGVYKAVVDYIPDVTMFNPEPNTYYINWLDAKNKKTSRAQIIVFWPDGLHTIYIRQKNGKNCPTLKHTYTSVCGCEVNLNGAIIRC